MKSITVSVTEFTDDLVKNAIQKTFAKIVSNSSYDFSSIDFGNTAHVYRIGMLLALRTINPKSNPAEFELSVTNGEKFDSHLQKNFKKKGGSKK